MALMAWSSEMSFSLSRLRSTLRSMSIAGRSKLRLRGPELHLDGAGAKRGVPEAVPGPLDVQGDPVRVGRDDPGGDGPRNPGNPRNPGIPRVVDGDLDQASHRAPPVPRIDQRAVDAGRGDFERVRKVAHYGHRVERGGELTADRRGVIQAYALVAVHHHPQQPPPARGAHPDRLQVKADGGDHGPDDVRDPALFPAFFPAHFLRPASDRLARLWRVTRPSWHHDLLVHDLRD